MPERRVEGPAQTPPAPSPSVRPLSAPQLLREAQLRDVQARGVRAEVARTVSSNRRVLARLRTTHYTGAEVDAMLAASPFFKPYVKPKLDKGIKADGHVHIHDDAGWTPVISAYLKGKINPNTNKVFTDDEAAAFGQRVDAFRDVREIHTHTGHGDPPTTIHESMHLFSHDDWIDKVGFNANEGATEYFTKKLCAENTIPRGNYYPDQHKSVKKLAGVVGDAALADAYFNADFSAIKSKLDGSGLWASIKSAFSSKWRTWIGYMKAGKYADADALL